MTASSLSASPNSDRKAAVIDEQHLERMTLGDRRLEREVLEIFVRQTAMMLDRIVTAQPARAAAAAHTLTGSARGIGAWRVARAAEFLEHAAGATAFDGSNARDDRAVEALSEAIAELKAASLEACGAIGVRLTGY
jgi:HPt (histidine-containing phosphotransfer) domain-containing protein